MVKFTCNRSDLEPLEKIAERADRSGVGYDRMTMLMDLDAAHSNGTPLDFEKLLAFPDFDFMHDIQGIRGHIDRKTGKLGDCFLPRCARTDR